MKKGQLFKLPVILAVLMSACQSSSIAPIPDRNTSARLAASSEESGFVMSPDSGTVSFNEVPNRAYTCPTANQLAAKLGVTVTEFHNTIKPQIIRDFRQGLSALGCNNPDVCLEDNGQDHIVLKCVNTSPPKVLYTDTPLDAYAP